MLYVYYIWESGDIDRDEAIANCKELKKWSDSCYIGKMKSFIANGKEIISDETFANFIENEMCDVKIEIPYISVVEVDDDYIVELLIEGLYDDFCEYADRIFNSEDMFDETVLIMNECVLGILHSAMEEMRTKIRKMKYGN